jgi:hypothetical protein
MLSLKIAPFPLFDVSWKFFEFLLFGTNIASLLLCRKVTAWDRKAGKENGKIALYETSGFPV